LLTAYFDESGIQENSPITLICGILAKEDAVPAFELDWANELGKHGISAFHASHCEYRTKEFGKLEDFQRAHIRMAFTETICKLKMRVRLWNFS
jgi:hypothetical protein